MTKFWPKKSQQYFLPGKIKILLFSVFFNASQQLQTSHKIFEEYNIAIKDLLYNGRFLAVDVFFPSSPLAVAYQFLVEKKLS